MSCLTKIFVRAELDTISTMVGIFFGLESSFSRIHVLAPKCLIESKEKKSKAGMYAPSTRCGVYCCCCLLMFCVVKSGVKRATRERDGFHVGVDTSVCNKVHSDCEPLREISRFSLQPEVQQDNLLVIPWIHIQYPQRECRGRPAKANSRCCFASCVSIDCIE